MSLIRSRKPHAKNITRQARGRRARADGRFAEWIAAFWLMAHGWRIVGFRTRTPYGEIDLLARRGQVLAAVEVKRRATLEAALEAVNPTQQQRLLRAAASLGASRAAWRGLGVRLDLIALAPGRWPCHLQDAWRGDNS